MVEPDASSDAGKGNASAGGMPVAAADCGADDDPSLVHGAYGCRLTPRATAGSGD